METVISNFKSSKQNFILSIYFQTVTYPLESSSANISTSTLDRRGSQNVGKSFNSSVFWITMVFSRHFMKINDKRFFLKINILFLMMNSFDLERVCDTNASASFDLR